MIGKLTGTIDSFGTDFMLLDVQGVGYQIYASRATLSKIGQKGDKASLLIDTHVREDAITLYGFADVIEQSWFRLLNSVQGVGAKAAFAILAVCPAERLAIIISAQDKAALTQADGVGPKLAARILTELKDKAGKIELSTKTVDSPVSGSVDKSSTPGSPSGVEEDAISALINLGYGRADAFSAVLKVKDKANDNLQALIREALKELSA
ncbi:MAG: Holliday junction branch migration protein RuvA [Micavibrio sp.]|nr:Holliday junction branch migration protein RuvA [Micavibrio sp.]|tara:strand:- start:4335 stop:4961 length:627 start_codon:yes stop_codon:yes gene_type:complete